MRHTLEQNIAALTKPRIIHANITDERGSITGLHSSEHPPLVDLLENGTGTRRGTTHNPPGSRYLIDEDALELWAEMRDHLRAWGRKLGAPWFDELSIDLQCWHEHHKAAVLRGRIGEELEQDIERTVDRWRRTIESKFDPDRKIEFTSPCPVSIRYYDADGGLADTRVCGARTVTTSQGIRPAITINLSRSHAECLACGTRWEGERALRSLVWAAEQIDWLTSQALTDALEAEEATERRDLALTGPIDLP